MKNKFSSILPFVILLRPYQWIKNILLFGGVIFSTSLFEDDAFYTSLAAFGVFCIASSSIYVLNDLCDVEHDKLNPAKRNRPIASGKVSKNEALLILCLLLPASILLAYLLNQNFFIIIMAYLILTIGYSLGLKKVVILDAMIVAAGFLLRTVAGCVVINVEVSPWLFICTLSLALTLSFGKRRNELNTLKGAAKNFRGVLEFYTAPFLDIILTICSTTAVVTYSLYTMSNETVLRFGNQQLIMTMPFVMYGIFRYLYLIYTQNKGGDPTKLLLKDPASVVNLILWALIVIYVIYGKSYFQF